MSRHRGGYPTRENGRWRFTAPRRHATARNWKIYLLRGWFALAKLYELNHIMRAVHYELAELEAEPQAKSKARKRRISQ